MTGQGAPELASLTVDVVVFGGTPADLRVLLVERATAPFAGYLTLPGGPVAAGEGVAAAAYRVLAERTGLNLDVLEYLAVYATPQRDPRGRCVSFAYTATVPGVPEVTTPDGARCARWVPVAEQSAVELAFDHREIVNNAVFRQRTYSRLGWAEVPGDGC